MSSFIFGHRDLSLLNDLLYIGPGFFATYDLAPPLASPPLPYPTSPVCNLSLCLSLLCVDSRAYGRETGEGGEGAGGGPNHTRTRKPGPL
jgi:hypothetical protein